MRFLFLYYSLYILYFFVQHFHTLGLQLYFLNVGQGDAILIRSPHTIGLVDGGPDYSLDYSIDNKIPFFMCKLDYLLATHPHNDHIAGLNRVLKRCKVSKVLVNNVSYPSKIWHEFIKNANALSTIYSYPDLPSRLSSDYDTEFFAFTAAQCLQDVNVCSLVLKIVAGSTSILLTGDMYSAYLEKFRIGHIDILKVPHHGGKNTLSDALLTSFSPRLGVLSYGASNKYGHPAAETVGILARYKIKSLHTLHGDVLVKISR